MRETTNPQLGREGRLDGDGLRQDVLASLDFTTEGPPSPFSDEEFKEVTADYPAGHPSKITMYALWKCKLVNPSNEADLFAMVAQAEDYCTWLNERAETVIKDFKSKYPDLLRCYRPGKQELVNIPAYRKILFWALREAETTRVTPGVQQGAESILLVLLAQQKGVPLPMVEEYNSQYGIQGV